MPDIAITGSGPTIEAGVPAASPIASNSLWSPVRPTIRLTHPRRAVVPGSASPTASPASKCDRLGVGESGGVQHADLARRPHAPPSVASAPSSADFGTAMFGRAP